MVYIGRQQYMDRLDAHAAGDGPPLVVAGEFGGGKSALLANWTHAWSEQHPETPVLVHFIGSTPDSANWKFMLQRLLGEFQRKFGFQIEIPDQPDALRMAFTNALHTVAALGRLVIVIGTLNQLEDRDGAQDLIWLPPVIPANVRIVFSTLSGRAWEELMKRAWPTLAVEPLTPPERQELIEIYLRRYGKKLDAKSCRNIVEAPQTSNPLFLGTLLNELRLVGTNDALRDRISRYLSSGTAGIIHSLAASLKGNESGSDSETLSSELQLSDLYEKILDRWQRDYGQSEPPYNVDIVREGLGLVYVSRYGLSETELLEALGSEGSPLPRAVWSPLFLAAGDALVNRGGLLTFANEALRSAVSSRYMSGRWNYEGQGHRNLAEYFKKQPLGKRQLDELPWQWLYTGNGWFHLVALFTQPAFLSALWRKNPSEVAIYWTQIEEHSPLRMEKTYASVIQNPMAGVEHASIVAALLQNKGNLDEAFRIRGKLLEYYQRRGELRESQSLMAEQASLLRTRGDLEGALTLCKMQERLCRESGNKHVLSTSLAIQGDILAERGELNGALELYRETERICRETGNTYI
jgi:tetratricopeptide (TPR) repeat protein